MTDQTGAGTGAGSGPAVRTTPTPRGGIPWWGRVSSIAAPVLLIGGWSLAASLQPGGFDSVVRTISELAGLDATDRWVMTLGIGGTGVCHVVTAAALRPAAGLGRRLLALGGAMSVLVALVPLPAGGGTSSAHSIVAFAAFVLLTVWAPFARRAGAGVPWGLRPRAALAAGAVLTAATALFFLAVVAGWSDVGLFERIAAGMQAMWPAVVVATVPRSVARR